MRKYIKTFRQYNSIILYGAGTVGQRMEQWLLRAHFGNIRFAITGVPEKRESCNGTPIFQIDELLTEKGSALVLISTLYSFQQEIADHLEELGFAHVIPVDDEILYEAGVVQVYGYYIERHKTLYGGVDRFCKKIWEKSDCRDLLLFESRMDYTDNARAMSEYIDRVMPGKYKKVWIVQKKRRKDKNNAWVIRKNPSLVDVVRLNYYVSHAKYIFLTHPGWVDHSRDGQTIVQMGHGNPFKTAVYNVSADSRNRYADYVLASSEDGAIYRKREYGEFARHIVVLGPPRNDWLYDGNQAIREYVPSQDIDHIVLCLPTFKVAEFSSGALSKRQSDSAVEDPYGISPVENEEDLAKLNEWLKERRMLLLCKDHFIEVRKEHRSLSHIQYLTNEDLEEHGHDMTQLLAGADALLTDFSSVFMDYLLLDRPVGFFVNHTDEYSRGFAVEKPERYMAGAKIHSLEDLMDFLEDVHMRKDTWAEERKAARDLIHKYQDAKNCERLAEFLSL